MIVLIYLTTSVWRRRAESFAAVCAVAITVAFAASLGSFVSHSRAQLTARSAAGTALDWQVQVSPGADPAAVRAIVQQVPDLGGVVPVDYARVAGLVATTATGTRTTGTAVVVSLPPDYQTFAPGQVRLLLGQQGDVAVQQQTAANLGVAPGDTVTVEGGPRGNGLRIAAIIDLRQPDTFFQVIGAPPGAGASAPPDNVVFVRPEVFSRVARGAVVVHQFHVRLRHDTLPHDPAVAADLVTQRANHLAAQLAGAGLVGDNLGAALSGARQDAIFAQLLVLLIGLPGLVLAGVVTGLVVALRADRQRRDVGLLRLRGASVRTTVALVAIPALVDGLVGAGLGVLGAVLADRLALGPSAHLSTLWTLLSAGAGVVVAILVETAPTVRKIQGNAVAIAQSVSAPPVQRLPLPLRLWLDVILLVASAVVFGLTAKGGYQVVVVPEGVPVASVNYAALLGPVLAWPGLVLLVWRACAAAFSLPRRVPATDPRGRVRDVRATVIRQRRRPLARGATGLAVAIAVTVSTAVFTSSYEAQAHVDVALTVGSDVSVTLPADSQPGILTASAAVRIPSVTAVEPMLHRLAYVGPDLQDLYGVNPRTIGRAAPLLDAFTPGSTVGASLARLAATPDGAMLAQETLHDYQLHRGDVIRLRLKDAAGSYRPVGFRVVGVITEFATAPRDSFIVANRDYIAKATGSDAVQTLLMKTTEPTAVAAALRRISIPPAVVADRVGSALTVGSAAGLAGTDLNGLARLTLGFGLILALSSSVLALVAGMHQRRRALAVLSVLGGTARQRRSFLRSEAAALVGAGVAGGLLAGWVIAAELVKVLNGLFDPPPEHPAVPYLFLTVLIVSVVLGSTVAVTVVSRLLTRTDAAQLRAL